MWKQTKSDFQSELYRIFGFDPDVPVTLEIIASRVHPDDIPLMNEKMEMARDTFRDFDYGIRLLMPDDSIKYLHMMSYGIRRPGWAAGVYRRDSGCDATADVARGTCQGQVGACTRRQCHEPGYLNGVNRARGEPAALRYRH